MMFVAPFIVFIVLQFYRYVSVPWPIELLISIVPVLPYMLPTKPTREIGVQTDSDEVFIKRTPLALVTVGIIPLLFIPLLCAFF
jgi:hypothetical protein